MLFNFLLDCQRLSDIFFCAYFIPKPSLSVGETTCSWFLNCMFAVSMWPISFSVIFWYLNQKFSDWKFEFSTFPDFCERTKDGLSFYIMVAYICLQANSFHNLVQNFSYLLKTCTTVHPKNVHLCGSFSGNWNCITNKNF